MGMYSPPQSEDSIEILSYAILSYAILSYAILSYEWLSHHCASLRKAMRSQHHHGITSLPALFVWDVFSKDTP